MSPYYLREIHDISLGNNLIDNIFIGLFYLILCFSLITVVIVYIISVGFKDTIKERKKWINKMSKAYNMVTRERINSGPDDEVSPEYYENIMSQNIKNQIVNENKNMVQRINSTNNLITTEHV